MAAVTDPPQTMRTPASQVLPQRSSRGSHWIDEWDPEDAQFWNSTGRRIARRNLVFSILSDHLGFCIWVIWTIIVINLSNVGITVSLSEQFVITLVPNLIGSMLRIPYTFALPRFGGRMWTLCSTIVLVVPASLLAIVVPSGWLAHQGHQSQYLILLVCAASAGLGGANFSSSMANISYFYPEREKGFALGLNAAGGNLGVAVSQFLVPLVVIIGIGYKAVKVTKHHVHIAYAGFMWLPLLALAALGAWKYMNSLSQARADKESYVGAFSNVQTWILSLLYIGTFGSFIGFSFALPLVIKNTFPDFLGHHPFIATYLAGLGFLGALLGSLARPLGGRLSDRMGGARVALAVFIGMAVFSAAAVGGVERRNFALFFVCFMMIFILSGAGNGAVYKMIPSIFALLGIRKAAETGADARTTTIDYKRRAAAVIGIAGSIGAFGGVLIQVVLRQSSLHVSALVQAAKTPARKLAVAAANDSWSVPALWVFFAAYLVLALITWAVYVKRKSLPGEVSHNSSELVV